MFYRDNDKNGNITKVGDVTYSYDEAGQLTRVNDPQYGTTVYVYDVGGNIKYIKSYDYTTGELGDCTGTITYNYTDSWKDLWTEYNGQAITYDGAGNPLSYRDGMQFTWELGRQLKTASKNGKTYSFKYNPDGLRTQKTAGTVTTDFYWANGNLTYQDDGTNELYFCYDDAGAPVSVNINGTDYYYVKNLQGDIIALLDGQGVCVVKYTYDAWGKILEIEDNTENNIGTINPLRYRGYYYDSDLGFYYLRSRYYDPTVGRFLNADEVDYLGASGTVLSYNLFAYCENDGVNFGDAGGHWVFAATISLSAAFILGVNVFATLLVDSSLDFGIFIGVSLLYGAAVRGLGKSVGIYWKYARIKNYLSAVTGSFSVALNYGGSLVYDYPNYPFSGRRTVGVQILYNSTGVFCETAPFDDGLYIPLRENLQKFFKYQGVTVANFIKVVRKTRIRFFKWR